MRGHVLVLVVLAPALALLPACSDEPDPDRVAALADRALRDVIEGHITQAPIGHRLHDLGDADLDDDVTPATCDHVDRRLDALCADLHATEPITSCQFVSSFHYAHAIPRCAVRFIVQDDAGEGLARLYALDASGTPLEGPPPSCGNGHLDAGEECDDGNFELWDGCDSTCHTEEFEGCEAVIEQVYQQRGLAFVDRTTWQGKRSHLMVNDASALREVTPTTCAEAAEAADEACRELTAQMPFVGGCWASHALHDLDGAPACSVRLAVEFRAVAPEAGVYTTRLDGELAFTIR